MSTTKISKQELKDWIDSIESETISIEQVIEDLEERALRKEVQRRSRELESGEVQPISAEEFEKHAAQLKKEHAE
jgi:predicted DNA-binding protein